MKKDISKAPLACEQAVYSRHIFWASANHRVFLMELAFQMIYSSLASTALYSVFIGQKMSLTGQSNGGQHA